MQIKKAAVLGAGVMGASIAAHIANAGIPCLLLDIVPKDLAPGDNRNRVAQSGLETALKAKPAAFFSPELAKLITVGNFEDDLNKLNSCDWIIEAVIENLPIKKSVYERLEPHLHSDAIISSNTSGIPIVQLIEGRNKTFRKNFLGTHFFNPPRYLHLLEIITTPETDPNVVNAISDFCDRTLGKGIVKAKDTPNFIANRIGIFSLLDTIKVMLERGYTIEEVDSLTGTVIGHAKSATFRTLDVVGLDTVVHVANNLYPAVPNDEKRDSFVLPDEIRKMIDLKLLGEKTKSGFFKKTGNDIQTLDLKSFQYRPKEKAKIASVDAAKTIDKLEDRLKTLVYAKDRGGEFLWPILSETFIYTANRIPEIADNIVEIDNAMKWGFAHQLGIFETWDAIGLEQSVSIMKQEGRAIPANIEKMLATGAKSFYKSDESGSGYFDFASNSYKAIPHPAGITILKSLKDQSKIIKKNTGASLIDLGDGIACVEFHSKMNSLGQDQLGMIQYAVKEAEKNFAGLVIGNQGENFSAGANIMMILMASQDGEWDELSVAIKQFQKTTMCLRYSPRPVVVAPHHLVLGGGCEMVLHADRVVASAETYIGLVEAGVGIIPAGGGTKELTLRAATAAKESPATDHFEALKRNFEMAAMGKVTTSAMEAKNWGILRKQDNIVLNDRRLIEEAKQTALNIARAGYIPPQPREDITVLGEVALTKFKLGVHMMREAEYISEHDALIGLKIANVMSGGNLTRPTKVTEQYLLDLEREAFLSLCGTKKTQERIAHMLKTGKPLRN